MCVGGGYEVEFKEILIGSFYRKMTRFLKRIKDSRVASLCQKRDAETLKQKNFISIEWEK